MASVSLNCRECSKVFARNSSLRRHVKQYHAGIELPPCLSRGPKPRKQPLVKCQLCGRSFSSRQSVWNHRRMKHKQPNSPLPSSTPQRRTVEKMEFPDITGTIAILHADCITVSVVQQVTCQNLEGRPKKCDQCIQCDRPLPGAEGPGEGLRALLVRPVAPGNGNCTDRTPGPSDVISASLDQTARPCLPYWAPFHTW